MQKIFGEAYCLWSKEIAWAGCPCHLKRLDWMRELTSSQISNPSASPCFSLFTSRLFLTGNPQKKLSGRNQSTGEFNPQKTIYLSGPATAEDHHGRQASGEERPCGGLGDRSEADFIEADDRSRG